MVHIIIHRKFDHSVTSVLLNSVGGTVARLRGLSCPAPAHVTRRGGLPIRAGVFGRKYHARGGWVGLQLGSLQYAVEISLSASCIWEDGFGHGSCVIWSCVAAYL